MAQMNENLTGFLDTFTRALAERLSESGPDKVTIVWKLRNKAETLSPDLQWCSLRLSLDPSSRVLVGSTLETWQELGQTSEEGCFALLGGAIEGAAQARFGPEVRCADVAPADGPPEGWTGVSLAIRHGEASCPPVDIAISPELEDSLGGSAIARNLQPVSSNAADLLMHVEMPVSVSFGRTRMRMHDLLGLTDGSIVELDQALADDVEVWVNNCVIARGEVVAVDGNYGVRIREMVSSRNARVELTGASEVSKRGD